ncbi:MAG TPA: MFS transporter [Ktedonobacterales bacterium]
MMDTDTLAPAAPPSLWHNHDFTKLWAGQTVSLFGTLLSRVALPFIAVLLLHATAAQMAVLTALEVIPAMLLGLFVGHLVDRTSRRMVMLLADSSRAIVPIVITLAYVTHTLRLEHLYVVAALMSVLTVFFDVAYPAYLPTVVGRAHLLAGNTRMEASAALAEVGGFSLSGVVVQMLGGPFAMVIDSLTYVVSAISLAFIRTPEPAREPVASHDDEVKRPGEIWAGARAITREPLRLALASAEALTGLAQNMIGTVFFIFVARDLPLHPAELGVIFGIGGVASFLAALYVPRLTARFGVGRVIVLAGGIAAAASFLLPLARGPVWVLIAILVIGQLSDAPATMAIINRNSLLQAITPDALQGRVHGAVRAVAAFANLAGIMLGGVLGSVLGARSTIAFACVVEVGVVLLLALSPVRRVHTMLTTPLE